MLSTLKNTIGVTLLRYVFGCYFLVAVILTSLHLFSEYVNAKDNIFGELANLGETVENSLARSVWNYNKEQARATLLGVGKTTMVSGTKLIDIEGNIFSSNGEFIKEENEIHISRKEKFSKPGDVSKVEYSQNGNKKTVFEYKSPIYHVIYNTSLEKDVVELVGHLYIYSNYSYIVEKIKYGFIFIIANALIKTIALWFIFLFFANKIIAKPLGTLTEATKEINSENYKNFKYNETLEKINCSTEKNELHTLVGNFFQMRHSISEKINIIEQQKTNLEQRVRERTATIEEVNRELNRLLLHDPLTGLANRKLFYNRLEKLLENSKKNKTSFIVASIDLCKFKEVNDIYGHQAGDYVLKELSERMSMKIRDTDTLARMGGDEFAMIFPNADEKIIETIGEKIVECAENPIRFENNTIYSGVNIGFSIYPDHIEKPYKKNSTEKIDYASMLFKNADIAMYEAKQNKKGLSFFTPKIKRELKRREIITRDLEYAIERKQISLYYQPIICGVTHQAEGVESLLRWQHPTLGLIPPDEFIEISERSKMIKTLTLWVINQSLSDGESFQKIGHNLNISINLSAQLINDPTFPEDLERIINKYKFPEKNITLELTESITIKNPEQVIEVLKQLKKIGVKLSIDDFGTGYSSFSYMARLPIDELKIDRTFFCDFDENSKIIAEAIIAVAHRLKLKVVAKGIEEKEILQFIENIDCDYIQGYYFSEAVPCDKLLLWLKSFNEVV